MTALSFVCDSAIYLELLSLPSTRSLPLPLLICLGPQVHSLELPPPKSWDCPRAELEALVARAREAPPKELSVATLRALLWRLDVRDLPHPNSSLPYPTVQVQTQTYIYTHFAPLFLISHFDTPLLLLTPPPPPTGCLGRLRWRSAWRGRGPSRRRGTAARPRPSSGAPRPQPTPTARSARSACSSRSN